MALHSHEGRSQDCIFKEFLDAVYVPHKQLLQRNYPRDNDVGFDTK